MEGIPPVNWKFNYWYVN